MSGDVVVMKPLNKMKPCPFCGGKNIIVLKRYTGQGLVHHYFMVQCDKCKAGSGIYQTPVYAEEAWNKRAENGYKVKCPFCGISHTVVDGFRNYNYCPNCGERIKESYGGRGVCFGVGEKGGDAE